MRPVSHAFPQATFRIAMRSKIVLIARSEQGPASPIQRLFGFVQVNV